MYSQLLRFWVVGRARSAWRVVCAKFLILSIGCLRDDGPRWCWSSGGALRTSRRHVVVAARLLAPSPLAAPRERDYGSAPKPRGGRARRCAGGRGAAVVRCGRWPSGGRHTHKKKHLLLATATQPRNTQQSRIQKQKGPGASRQRRLVAAVCSRPPSKANSAWPARVRHEQPEQPEHSQIHTHAPPLVRLEHPEQRTTAGPVDCEHPVVFVRLVRVKIAYRFGH